MNRALEEVPTTPNLTQQAQWKEIAPLVYQRPCIGQEHSASYNQNVADGHTELSCAVRFSVNMSTEELIAKGRKAWLNCRFLHPETAVELSTDDSVPQLMTYRLLSEQSQADAWTDETYIVELERTFEDVLEMTYNRKLTSIGKQAMMYLVLDRRPLPDDQRHHSIIWNVSHAVTDAFSIVQFLNTYLSEIVKGDSDDILQSEDVKPSSIVKHLPISPLVSYEKLFKPSEKEKKESLKQAQAQLALYKDRLSESVAMYPDPDHASRPHYTHCLATKFTLQESVNIISSLKSAKIGITYAGAAATILATYQMYGRGHEAGALLGMTRNARRWIATVLPSTGRVAIPMATDVVFLWIPFDKFDKRDAFTRPKDFMLSLAHEIRAQLQQHLLTPHYLSSVPYMSDLFVENLRTASSQAKQAAAEVVAPSSPGFSSQGALALKKEYQAGKHTLIRQEFIHTGRQVGTSPWIGMFSLDNALRFSIGFDSKYYRREPMQRFLDLVRENVASVMTETQELSKL